MAVNKKKRLKLNLAAGRPPTIKRSNAISRKATRNLINRVHTLQKRKSQAVQNGNEASAAAIEAEISALGGIEKYQQASLQGQRNDRGGDSSRILLSWLRPVEFALQPGEKKRSLRMLEVGALSTKNACSLSGYFDIERIDLNSQGEGILRQDFMERPLPKDDAERFDLISLSLVLNFVPDPKGRGDMLVRTLDFLHVPAPAENDRQRQYLPGLFLVLPAPCVSNSRYLDDTRLEAIMKSLGYEMTMSKKTHKLVYYLWTRTARAPKDREMVFTKREIRPGGSRNNFAIVLKAP